MARCKKCLMDPCLCHIGGFGSDEDEDTTKKDIEELMDRRCIVKVSDKGNKTFLAGIRNFKTEDRATDVTGTIKNIQVVASNTHKEDPELIDLGLDTEQNIFPPGVNPIPIFYIKYDVVGYNGIAGHWYIDEEVIYL